MNKEIDAGQVINQLLTTIANLQLENAKLTVLVNQKTETSEQEDNHEL